MAWNEPGKGRDPWSGRGNDKGPPDLDEIVKNLQKRFGALFGGGAGSGGGGPGVMGFGLLGIVALVAWAASGLYKVDDAERGVVLRFGEYHQTTLPGLHWRIPYPVDTVEKVNVASIDRYNYKTQMLTADENIVAIDLAVQFRRSDPRAYLFNVRDPDGTLGEVGESAIREVVGKNKLDFVLREGRAEIAELTRALMQSTLDAYGTGIEVTSVNLQDANFPSAVEASVQDAIKAREDKERLALEAQAYSNDIVPRARGAAARQIEAANAYKEQVIARSQGEASRFTQLLREYERAPEVTRERLYLESLEDVFSRSRKVLLDGGEEGGAGNNSLIYLPLDKLMDQQRKSVAETGRPSVSGDSSRVSSSESSSLRSRDDLRARGNR